MQGWTPLHVALFPKTHIKNLVDWTWTEMYHEHLEDYIVECQAYDKVRKQIVSCSHVTCHEGSLCYQMKPLLPSGVLRGFSAC